MIKQPLPTYVEAADNTPVFVIVTGGVGGMQIEQQPLIFTLDPVPPPSTGASAIGRRERPVYEGAPSFGPNLQGGGGGWRNHLPLMFPSDWGKRFPSSEHGEGGCAQPY